MIHATGAFDAPLLLAVDVQPIHFGLRAFCKRRYSEISLPEWLQYVKKCNCVPLRVVRVSAKLNGYV